MGRKNLVDIFRKLKEAEKALTETQRIISSTYNKIERMGYDAYVEGEKMAVPEILHGKRNEMSRTYWELGWSTAKIGAEFGYKKEVSTYHSDYPSEPIGGDNPYYCCSFCGISDPAINGNIEGHLEHCQYRIEKEKEQKVS